MDSPRSPQSPQQDPALQLSHQNRIRNLYPYGVNHQLGHDSPDNVFHGDSPRENVTPDHNRHDSISSMESQSSMLKYHDSVSSFSEADNDADSVGLDDSSKYLRGSLRSSQKSRSGSSSQGDAVSKSVTFAENLISEEISFDPSSSRLSYSGQDEPESGVIGGNDVPPLPPRQVMNFSRENSTGSSDQENEVEEGSRTASKLKEHFERMGKNSNQVITSPKQHESLNANNSSRISNKDSSVADVSSENVALKVLADVANQRAAVELMQRQNLMETQIANQQYREDHGVPSPRPVPAQRKSMVVNTSPPANTSASGSVSASSTIPSSTPTSNTTVTSPFYAGPDAEPMFPRQAPAVAAKPAVTAKPVTPSQMKNSVNAPQHSNNVNHVTVPKLPLAAGPSVTYKPISPHQSPQLPSTRPHSSSAQPPASSSSPQIPNMTRKPSLPPRAPQSAYSALFPQGGPKAVNPRLSFNPFVSPQTSVDKSPSPSATSRLSNHSSMHGAGSGENSISSDNSEGAESNLQSSVSSGYHSENGGLFQRSNFKAKSLPPSSRLDQDRGVYTQEFVNRTSSFTYSSGSSSPFSRASNDEMYGPDGNPAVTSVGPLSNVLFPGPNLSSNQSPTLHNSNKFNNLRKSATNSNLSDGYSSEAEVRLKSIGDSNSSLSSQSLTPPVPLIKTNALNQSRPESSNSMSSQYSTSSSTLSTIYRPFGSRDSPKVRDQSSPAPNTNTNSVNRACTQSPQSHRTPQYSQNTVGPYRPPQWQEEIATDQTFNHSQKYHGHPPPYHGTNSNSMNSSSDSTNPRYHPNVNDRTSGNSFRFQNGEDPSKWHKSMSPVNSIHNQRTDIPMQTLASGSGHPYLSQGQSRVKNGVPFQGQRSDHDALGLGSQVSQEAKGKLPPNYVLHSSKC